MSGRASRCGNTVHGRVPDRLHADPENFQWSKASASTTTVAFLDSLHSTSCQSRQALVDILQNLWNPWQWNLSSLSFCSVEEVLRCVEYLLNTYRMGIE